MREREREREREPLFSLTDNPVAVGVKFWVALVVTRCTHAHPRNGLNNMA